MNSIEKYISAHTQAESELLQKLNRETHAKILMPRMLSGHVQGKILEMISKMINPDYIIEIGTYTGYSALCLAQGLSEKGQLHTIEINDELERFTRPFFENSEFAEKINFHIGDAIKIIPNLKNDIDLVFIDADKRNYLAYYKVVIEKVKKGGFILADNVLWGNKVIQKLENNDLYTKGILEFNKFVHEDPRVENVILPIRDGIMILRKV
ncbi:MAG: class I SAM-dependent methyltransferase [Bacteroidales bacterium]|nr:class I SAM-dependent methyltransferase [Bacteroidales bacterium]MBN2756605.1 class I SAM-dependent methyltransferase [Bacteroidales bacterium]